MIKIDFIFIKFLFKKTMNNEVYWLDLCYNGGEYDIARYAYEILGVIDNDNVLSVNLSENIAKKFAMYGNHLQGNDREKADVMLLIARKLKSGDFKRKVISEYKVIVSVYSQHRP